MRQIPIAELVFDFSLYPRQHVDGQHVASMVEAIKAGRELPPGVCDKKSKRVTDGWHRAKAHERVDGPTAKMPMVEKTYKSEKEMLLDAMRYNAQHGRNLSPYDRAHAILLGEKVGLTVEKIADALSITVQRVEDLRVEKTGIAGNGKKGKKGTEVCIPIKRTIGHMAGKVLNKKQQAANKRLGGMNQLFYANQLILLIEEDLLDKENEKLIEALRKLHGLLDGVVAVG